VYNYHEGDRQADIYAFLLFVSSSPSVTCIFIVIYFQGSRLQDFFFFRLGVLYMTIFAKGPDQGSEEFRWVKKITAQFGDGWPKEISNKR